jgi:hypothetical protein
MRGGQHPHGAEHLKDLLVGQILWAEPRELLPVAALYAVVIAAVRSFDVPRRRALFYVVFAVAVTASFQLVGVFLVFASLIVRLSRRPPQAVRGNGGSLSVTLSDSPAMSWGFSPRLYGTCRPARQSCARWRSPGRLRPSCLVSRPPFGYGLDQ